MKNLLSILIALLLFTSCWAQQLGERLSQTSVRIYNNSGSEITVLLGKEGRMDTLRLEGNKEFLSPPYNFNPIIQIQTQKKIVKYTLKPGNFYMIYWNEKKKYWDVKKKSY